MLDRVLLDDEDFRVTAGLLGGIHVTLKRLGLKVKALPEERTFLLDVLGLCTAQLVEGSTPRISGSSDG